MFKKISVAFLVCFCLQLVSFADDLDDVRAFFNRYVEAANGFSKTLPDYYLTNAKIVRVVEKKDGTTANAIFPMSAYKEQMASKSGLAKLVKYRNNYKNINVKKASNGDYKLTAMRFPNNDKEGLACTFVITKVNNNYKIKEEWMHTKVQDFLKYVK